MLYCVGYEGIGGMNLFVDGFFVVEKLKKNDKDFFDFFLLIIFFFYYKFESFYIKVYGLIIELDFFNGDIF